MEIEQKQNLLIDEDYQSILRFNMVNKKKIKGKLSKSALEALDEARKTPENEYVDLE